MPVRPFHGALLLVATALLLARGVGAGQTAFRPPVEPFPLEDVRLLNSPFRSAMEADARYLLSLSPDRLLHRFREYAGLPPKAPLYGGWEAQGISGHTLGHYLSACSLMYASTGDARFKQRVDDIVSDLALCQSRHSDGYVGAIPDGERVFKQVAGGDIRSQGFDLNGAWVPWYTLHKLFAGLLDAQRYCRSAQALQVAERLAGWASRTTGNLTADQWQKMLACEQGGMNEALANLYALTHNPADLSLSQKFYHHAVMDPLARREDHLAGLHANTQIPKVIGCARLYELTGQPRYRDIAETFWSSVAGHHSYVIGGCSSSEYLSAPDRLADTLAPNTAETCCTYNMLKLTRSLFCWRPTVALADFYERGLYNHILASQDSATGMTCYYVPLLSGERRVFSTPFDSFWCCTGTGMENHAKYGDSIYFHDASTLYVSLFIPSTLNWRARGMRIRQETAWPVSDTTRLTVSTGKPQRLTVKIRYPGWSAGRMVALVNGRAWPINSAPGSFVSIAREWRNGDTVRVTIPMGLREVPMPDNPSRVALMKGPIVLAGNLGPASSPAPEAPVLVSTAPGASALITRAAGPLSFSTVAARPHQVSLAPFNTLQHARSIVYWDRFTPAEWEQRQEEYKRELARRHELEARTIDLMAIGEMQPERDHSLWAQNSAVGEFRGRKWRHATDGGWISFDMAVREAEPAELILTFWGSDSGGRVFDILVDHVRAATVTLDNNAPGKFYDYVVPVEPRPGAKRVNIMLQAHTGMTAGGLFGARMVRRKPQLPNR